MLHQHDMLCGWTNNDQLIDAARMYVVAELMQRYSTLYQYHSNIIQRLLTFIVTPGN